MRRFGPRDPRDPESWPQPGINWMLVLACGASGFIMGIIFMSLVNWGAK